MFALLEIDQTYGDGYIQSIKCLSTFSSEEEAQNYKKLLLEQRAKQLEIRNMYITNYVNKIEIPEEVLHDYEKWKSFVKFYAGYEHTHFNRKNFHESLIDLLKNGFKCDNLINYNPPHFPEMTELYIVEINM